MRWKAVLATFMLAHGGFAAPFDNPIPGLESAVAEYAKVFKHPRISSSTGGKAACLGGIIDVTASANNVHVNLEEPADQIALTEVVTELLQINSTLPAKLAGGVTKICLPVHSTNISAIEFLIHGAGFDRSYWDIAPGYSYIDFAAERGYATFSYDRLGVGLSDHPDPIQTVQLGVHVAIAHELIKLLRNGTFSDHAFDHVVGVGHSYGSLNVISVTTAYPTDFDAVVLTGFSSSSNGIFLATAALGLAIASESQPYRFAGLSHGYLSSASIVGIQTFFFRAPGFDPALLDLAESTQQTTSLGEQLTFAKPKPSTLFTGPIDVVNGLNDLPNCSGNCLYPVNLAAGVKEAYYPAARNASFYLPPDTGHGVNLHYSAPAAYEHIHNNLRDNGI